MRGRGRERGEARGPGRGGRGRRGGGGGGRGAGRTGPRLPMLLRKELGLESSPRPSRGLGRSGGWRRAGAKRKFTEGGRSGAAAARDGKPRSKAEEYAPAEKQKIHDMVGYEADLRLQSALRKRLKLTKVTPGTQLDSGASAEEEGTDGEDDSSVDGVSDVQERWEAGGQQRQGREVAIGVGVLRHQAGTADSGTDSDGEGQEGSAERALSDDSEDEGQALGREGSSDAENVSEGEHGGRALRRGGRSGDDKREGILDGPAEAAVPACKLGRYLPPAARKRAASQLEASGSGRDAAETQRVERRVRGLLNRLAESNLQGIVADIAALYSQAGRRLVVRCVVVEIIAAVAEGPRATPQFAAVAAAFIAGLTVQARASELAASFLEALAQRLEDGQQREDSLTTGNLVQVLAHLYAARLVGCDVLYSLLEHLCRRFSEADVAMIVQLLRSCGLAMRGEDPAAMKEFVQEVHAAAAAKGRNGGLSKRETMMLDLVLDVKNNRKAAGSAAALPAELMRWLSKAGVEEVQIRSLSWAKVLQPGKKGMWWIPAAGEMSRGAAGEHAAAGATQAALAALTDGDGDAGGMSEEQLLRLAAGQRMNTDVRRAVFLVVVGSNDYMTAFERLLRLPLKGQQQREAVRVLLHCALAEKAWNPYYALLAAKLCSTSKNHKLTAQYWIWDHVKELEGLAMPRMVNLALLTAHLVASKALPLSAVRVAEFGEQMPSRSVFFWRLFFQNLLQQLGSKEQVEEVFGKLAGAESMAQLCSSLRFFLSRLFRAWLSAAPAPPAASGLGAAQARALVQRSLEAEACLKRRTRPAA